jgi:hypothetical protein
MLIVCGWYAGGMAGCMRQVIAFSLATLLVEAIDQEYSIMKVQLVVAVFV